MNADSTYPMNRKRLIVVLGMHRSGTSVITRGLKVLGVELGENFLPPQDDNITGFWEDADLNAFNIEVLNGVHSNWHFLTPIQQADVDTLLRNGYIQRAVEILQSKMSNAEIFGFKDPRVAKLLPFWKEVFLQMNVQVSYVLVLRHPLSVWKSLEKRHGFDLEKSSLLWLEHVISSLSGTSEEDCVLVDYDGFIQSPRSELERIAREFELTIDALELEKFESEFLDKGLRHTVYRLEDLAAEKSVLPLIQEVYATLSNVAANHIPLKDAVIQDQIAKWKNEFMRLTPLLAFVDKLNSQISTIMAEQDVKAQTLAMQLNEKDLQVQALAAQLNDITISKAWRVAMLLRRVSTFLFYRSHSS